MSRGHTLTYDINMYWLNLEGTYLKLVQEILMKALFFHVFY